MTRLIIISSETDFENETTIVNDLFIEGLNLLHLRKPNWNLNSQRIFLEKIDPAFLNRISVHQYHETTFEFGLKYFHVKESERKNLTKKKDGLISSTSFHSYDDLRAETQLWDYCFLSPLFDSISKSNYKSTFSKYFKIENDLPQRVFALGGITKNNIESVFEKGFYGAAVLGSVWNDPKKALKKFKELDTLCKQNVHTF